jgi:hypothetical protein
MAFCITWINSIAEFNCFFYGFSTCNSIPHYFWITSANWFSNRHTVFICYIYNKSGGNVFIFPTGLFFNTTHYINDSLLFWFAVYLKFGELF